MIFRVNAKIADIKAVCYDNLFAQQLLLFSRDEESSLSVYFLYVSHPESLKT